MFVKFSLSGSRGVIFVREAGKSKKPYLSCEISPQLYIAAAQAFQSLSTMQILNSRTQAEPTPALKAVFSKLMKFAAMMTTIQKIDPAVRSVHFWFRVLEPCEAKRCHSLGLAFSYSVVFSSFFGS